MKFYLILSLFILLFATGCSKDQANVRDSVLIKNANEPWYQEDDVDSVGHHHNNMLDSLTTLFDADTLTLTEIEEELETIAEDYYGSVPTTFNMISYLNAAVDTSQSNPVWELDSMHLDTLMSEDAMAFVEKIYTGLEAGEFERYQDVKDYLIEKEDSLVNGYYGYDLEDNEEDYLRAMLSVGRFSAYYWIEIQEVPINWWIVGGADLGGVLWGLFNCDGCTFKERLLAAGILGVGLSGLMAGLLAVY